MKGVRIGFLKQEIDLIPAAHWKEGVDVDKAKKQYKADLDDIYRQLTYGNHGNAMLQAHAFAEDFDDDGIGKELLISGTMTQIAFVQHAEDFRLSHNLGAGVPAHVPEFSTVAVLVFVVGIMSMIIFSMKKSIFIPRI